MYIKTPVIGIPEYHWHKKAWKYAKKNPNFIKTDISDFGFCCDPHIDFLKYLDDPSMDVRESKYWAYQKKTKSEEGIYNKIKKYQETYNRIKLNGFVSAGDKYNSSIIVTDDGCRLDGAHRISILLYLGITRVDVNVLIYEKVFSVDECRKIREDNLRYRKDNYNL